MIKEKKESSVQKTRVNAIYEKANLNPKYTFDTFVVGGNRPFRPRCFPSQLPNLRERSTTLSSYMEVLDLERPI